MYYILLIRVIYYMQPLRISSPIKIPQPNQNVTTRGGNKKESLSSGSGSGLTGIENMIYNLKVSTSPKEQTPNERIANSILSFGKEYHGLESYEIEDLVNEVVDTFRRKNAKSLDRSQEFIFGFSLSSSLSRSSEILSPRDEEKSLYVKKGRGLPRTVHFDFEKKVATVFLKTKGGLQEKKGTYWRGTRALRINMVTESAQKCFQLVPHDEKAFSQTAKKMPFDERLTPEEYKALKGVFLERYDLFTYTKKKKGTGEEIEKQCKVYPYMPVSLVNIEDNAKLLDHLHTLAKNLEVLHANGCVHWDVKLANIVSDGSRSKMIDFDHAFRFKRGESPYKQGTYGTRCFSAPEILENRVNEAHGYPACDMYAFGLIVAYLFYGQYPTSVSSLQFYREHPSEELLNTIISTQKGLAELANEARKEINTVCELDLFLEMVVALLLDPNPETRFTAKEVTAAIEEYWKRNLTNYLLK